MMQQLNNQQKEIVMYNHWHCKQSILQMREGNLPAGYKIFLSGLGGTGKSHVIKLINRDTHTLFHNANALDPADIFGGSWDPSKPTTLLTFLTRTAASNIDGSTVHSSFLTHVWSLSDEKKLILQSQLHQLQLLIIDEVSMMGSEMLQLLNTQCSMIKAKAPEELYFGNVNVLCIGDLYQFPSVMATPVYTVPTDWLTGSDLVNIWDDFQFHELSQVMQQCDMSNLHFSSIQSKPNNLMKETTLTVLWKLVKFQLVSKKAQQSTQMKCSLHIFAQNSHAHHHNETKLNELNTELIICESQDSSDAPPGMLVKYPTKISDTGNLVKTLILKPGAHVILTTNVNVTDGLTNRAFGMVKGHTVNASGKPHIIMVKYDSPKVGVTSKVMSIMKESYPDCVPVPMCEATFPLKPESRPSMHDTCSSLCH